jgi:hypothetical protein
MRDKMQADALTHSTQQRLHALTCQDVVLRFMGHFDARAWTDMEQLVTPDLVWQRPDRKISGLAHLRETLQATPDNVRVRHIITNLRPIFIRNGKIEIHSYFSVFRVTGVESDANDPVPFEGPVSVGRYCDLLVQDEGVWRISSKETHVDFRRT